MEFQYERLRVSAAALDANEKVWELLKKQRRYGSLERQIERACESVALNIAEGAGEFSASDKARFYRIALRSVEETAMALDVLQRRNPGFNSEVNELKEMLRSVAGMLVRLIQSTRARTPRHDTNRPAAS